MFKHILVAVTLFVCLTGNAMAFDDAKWQGLFRTAQTLLESKQPALAEAQLRAALSDEMPDNLRIATLTHLCVALYLQSKHQEAVAVATESVKLIEAREPNNLQALATSASILNMSAAKVGDTAAATLADEKLEYLKGEMVLQAWSTDERTGEKLHLHSGIRFPASFGTFGDPQPMAYRPDGSDASLNYRGSGPTPGLLSIYVTETPETVAQHIDNASLSIRITAGDTAPISQGEISIVHGGEAIQGQQRIWEYGERGGRLRGSVAVFQRGKYHIKFRATYPADAKDAFEEAQRKVMESFSWPGAS